jgi:hypothetical protein
MLDPENIGLAVAFEALDLPQLSNPAAQGHRLSSSSEHATLTAEFQTQLVVAPA